MPRRGSFGRNASGTCRRTGTAVSGVQQMPHEPPRVILGTFLGLRPRFTHRGPKGRRLLTRQQDEDTVQMRIAQAKVKQNPRTRANLASRTLDLIRKRGRISEVTTDFPATA